MAWIKQEEKQTKPREQSCFSKMWQLIRTHPVSSLLIAGGVWCGKQVLAVALRPIFDSWGIALQNTSLSALQKLASMKYIAASKYNMTDIFVGPAFVVVFAFLTWLWQSQIQLTKLHRDLKNALATNRKREARFKCLDSARTSGRAQEELRELQEDNLKEHQKMERDIRIVHAVKWSTGLLLLLSSIILIVSISFSLSVYTFKGRFERDCEILRPYMSDSDYHRLIRQWRLMTSKADYLAIEKQLEKVRGRIELYDNADRVNEIFRARAAAQEKGR
jgi:hypothetical protein